MRNGKTQSYIIKGSLTCLKAKIHIAKFPCSTFDNFIYELKFNGQYYFNGEKN